MVPADFLITTFIFLLQSSLFLRHFPLVWAQQYTPFRPNAIPLAVKTPYMNFWLLGGRTGPNLGDVFPKSVDGTTLGWCALVRVDGTTYSLMGSWIHNSANQTSVNITPTQTNFVFDTGPVNTKLNFLSPIHVSDYTRMSLPFTYLAFEVESKDGSPHEVQVYVDVTGELLSADTGDKVMNWTTVQKGDYVYHDFGLEAPEVFLEKRSRIEYGRGYHATALRDGLIPAICHAYECRDTFNSTGKPSQAVDRDFRFISKDWPVMAFSYNLTNVVKTNDPVVFVLGQPRDPLVQYQSPTAVEERSSFYQTQFSNIEDAVAFSIRDYKDALAVANVFDSKLQSDALTISSDYYSVVSLAARQVFARIEVTVGKKTDGSLNPDDILVFLKGDRISAIEEMYASAPFWLYVNPELLRLLLQPIVNEHTRIGIATASKGAVQDLGPGLSYPRVTGHLGTDSMPIEATGDFLIMTVAYVRASGNASIILDNYQLFDTFAKYLNDNTLDPGTQTSADSRYLSPLTSDTNLAVKGIIALKAYGDLLGVLSKPEASTYVNAATGFAQTWQQRSLTSDGEYRPSYSSDDASWSMMYNLFADKWLGTSLFPEDVYKRLSSTYQNKLDQFGVPIDSGSKHTKPEWMLFAAGLVPDTPTRDKLIESVFHFLSSGPVGGNGWCDLYLSDTGNTTEYGNRAVVGGVYSLLARDLPVKTIIETSSQNTSDNSATSPLVSWAVMIGSLALSVVLAWT